MQALITNLNPSYRGAGLPAAEEREKQEEEKAEQKLNRMFRGLSAEEIVRRLQEMLRERSKRSREEGRRRRTNVTQAYERDRILAELVKGVTILPAEFVESRDSKRKEGAITLKHTTSSHWKMMDLTQSTI